MDMRRVHFFGEDGMWPWLDSAVVSTDNIQIDWLAARKDGRVGFALMNESFTEITTEITLGSKVGADFTGDGILYRVDGSTEKLHFSHGKATVTIPGHTLVGIKIASKIVKAPKYAHGFDEKRGSSVALGNTVVNHDAGKGFVLQLSPDKYFGYVYVTHKPDVLKKLTMVYRIGNGETKRLSTETYPFEFIVEVSQPEQPLYYTLTLEKTDGNVDKLGEQVLKTN